eukprot:TRINITY_DN14345_c0_g1_i3.p3 TRINITY_DN14345_c0_g1~~TRINITY_DN14345_c0_g1_i3.p3  ORF type:complete len:144 (-),score=5.34 TRINITY_DN14345_c0_g1_i3:220-651(-)
MVETKLKNTTNQSKLTTLKDKRPQKLHTYEEIQNIYYISSRYIDDIYIGTTPFFQTASSSRKFAFKKTNFQSTLASTKQNYPRYQQNSQLSCAKFDMRDPRFEKLAFFSITISSKKMRRTNFAIKFPQNLQNNLFTREYIIER